MARGISIPKGTKVRVLDTDNVRIYNRDSIGYEFITDSTLYVGGTLVCPDNRYGVNYKDGDFLVIEKGIIDTYDIY